MKRKLYLCMFSLVLLNGCMLCKTKDCLLDDKGRYTIEKDAKLAIVMDNKDYANALSSLWNKTYPQHKDALHITCKKINSNSFQNADVIWSNDQKIAQHKKYLYDFDGLDQHIDYHVPDHLQRDFAYFLPVEGKGLVFVYNEDTLTKRGGIEDDLVSFERIGKLKGKLYYHDREADYAAPFLFTPHEEMGKQWLKEEDFYENLKQYRKLSEELSMVEDTYAKDTFYEGDYLCGLMKNDGTYLHKDVYKQGKLHVMKMPQYHDRDFSPIVDTYGFTVYKETKYPGACLAFLQLVRSEEGMQILIQYTNKIPLIKEEEVDTISVFDHTKKEMIIALNASQLRDISLQSYLKKSSFYSIIENSLYTKDSNEDIIKKLP